MSNYTLAELTISNSNAVSVSGRGRLALALHVEVKQNEFCCYGAVNQFFRCCAAAVLLSWVGASHSFAVVLRKDAST